MRQNVGQMLRLDFGAAAARDLFAALLLLSRMAYVYHTANDLQVPCRNYTADEKCCSIR